MNPPPFDPDRRQLLALAAGGALAGCGGAGTVTEGSALATIPAEAPPVAGYGFVQVTLRNHVAGLAPVMFGHVFRQRQLPAGATLAGQQLDVKNRWPDGSVAFGVVSHLLSMPANTAVRLPLAPGTGFIGPVIGTAELRATGITAAVDAGAFGGAAWSGADWDTPFATWIAGPVMSSWRYRKPVGSDPHLVAWLEVNLWRNGAVEVLPWVENGYLMVPGATNKPASYAFSLGGRERFRSTIDLLHHQRTVLVSGTATSHWLGTAHDVVVQHDGAYLQSTGVVPTYLARTPANARSLASLPRTFAPLQQGSWPAGMGSGGYHASIGLLPEWDALYLTSTAPEVFKGVVFNAYSAGRYAYHYRDETQQAQPHRPPRVSNYPTLTIREPSPGWPTPPANGGPSPPPWSLSHQPSSGFMAYLVTGRHYFLEELQFAAATNALYSPFTWRMGTKGIFDSRSAGATRHVAWCLRTLMQAAWATPDADTVFKAEFVANLRHNIERYHARYVARPHNPLGWITPYGDYNGGMGGLVAAGSTASEIVVQGGLHGPPFNETADDQYVGWRLVINGEQRTVTRFVMAQNRLTVSPPFSRAPSAGERYGIGDNVMFDATWMQAFFNATLGYMKDLSGLLDAATAAKLDALYSWNVRSIVGQFGTAAAGDFLFRDAMPYTMAVAPSETPDFDGGTGPWFANWGQVYAATFGGRTRIDRKPPPYAPLGPKVDGPLRQWLSPEGYLANGLPALAYAVRHGEQGALAAWQRLTAAPNWAEFLAGLHPQPVWAVGPSQFPQPRPPAAPAAPAWNRGQQPGEWREIPGSAMGLLTPRNEARTLAGGRAVVGPSSRMDAWCGLSIDTRSSRVWSLANGGHGDYYGNEVCTVDLTQDVPAWVEWCPGSNGNVVDQVTPPTHPSHARYHDGLPCSTHSYYGQQFVERADRVIRLGGSTAPYGSAFETVEGFDIQRRTRDGWDPQGTWGFCLGNLQGLGGWTPSIGWSACKDPRTENLYVVTTPNAWRFVPAAGGVGGAWSSMGRLPPALNSGALGATAVDTRRNRLLWVKGYGPNLPYTMDLASGAWTARAYPPGEARQALEALLPSPGMVYVPELDAFLVRGSAPGGRVWRIDAETMAVSYLPTGGGDGIPRGAVLSNEEGVYNRWLLVPQLRGVVYFPRASANAWFLQLY